MPISYMVDSGFLMVCMVVMFAELFYVHSQYREQIAKGKEVPPKTMKGVAIILGIVVLAQIIFSILKMPLHPLYLVMIVIPLFVFRFGMYEEGVYHFGHLYRWKQIKACHVLELGKVIRIEFVPEKNEPFTLMFDGAYQNFILTTLTNNHLMNNDEQ